VGEEECQVLLARRYKPNKRRKEYDEDDNLIEKTYSIADLSSGFVNPTKPEIDDFKGSKHPAAALALHTWSTPLNMDDRVQVVAGSLRGLKGVVSYIGEQTITLQPSTENVAPVDVLFSDVRKYFLQGDFVRIMHGPNEGEEGFILDIDEVRALLYKPGPSGQPGIEVRCVLLATISLIYFCRR
jgi:transcription elongation factor